MPVAIKGLSEMTMVQIVFEALKVAKRNLAMNEKIVKATEDNTWVECKFAEAITRLTHTLLDQ